jgi:hypothetical protein
MATVPGSHFSVTPDAPINIAETTSSAGLPPAVGGAVNFVAGDFNVEVFVGQLANAPPLSAGYPGLAVLSPSGTALDLVAGAFAVTDNGSGSDTISAFGTNETITGSAAGVTLNLLGNQNTAQAGSGSDTINASGSFDTVGAGSGAELINVSGSSDLINLGTGSDTVNVAGAGDTVTSGVNPGGNQALINLAGSNVTLAEGPNKYADTVVGFDQAAGDRIHLTTETVTNAVANSTQVNGGLDTLITLSDGSTILLKGISHIDSTFFS